MAENGERIAFLGIGTMGHGMAVSALRAGLPTIVWVATLSAPGPAHAVDELGGRSR